MSKRSNHAEGKTEDKGSTDEDNKIGGKKCHDKYKRAFETVRRYEQVNAVVQKKSPYYYQNHLSDPPEYNRHEGLLIHLIYQCQAQPRHIGNNSQRYQQDGDEGQGGKIKSQDRLFKTHTGNKKVDSQGRN